MLRFHRFSTFVLASLALSALVGCATSVDHAETPGHVPIFDFASAGISEAQVSMVAVRQSGWRPLLTDTSGQLRTPSGHGHEAFADKGRAVTTRAFSVSQDDEDLPAGFVRGNDGFTHRYSGLRCADEHRGFINDVEVGLLTLAEVRWFKDDGTDVACTYVGSRDTRLYTLYASKWPDISARDHFVSAYQDMAARFSGGTATEIPVVTMRANEETEDLAGETFGAGIAFTSDDGATGTTALYISKVGDWHIKARSTSVPSPENFLLWSTILHQINVVLVNERQLELKVQDSV
ncbi:MAG: hypothetical protein AAGH41_10360 [Pseudomonadota bacterium]